MYKSKNPNIHNNTIMESKKASSFEYIFIYINKEHESNSSLQVNQNIGSQEQEKDSINNDELIEQRRSKRTRIEKPFGLDFLTCMLETKPQTYKEAIKFVKGSF